MDERENRTATLRVRMHQTGYDRLQGMAVESGLTVSELARRIIADAVRTGRVRDVAGG